MSKKVFITGATGFLGSYLTRLLIEKGYEVSASKRVNSRMDLLQDIHSKVKWIDGDILDVSFLDKAIEGMYLVFHCAAIVSFSPKDVEKMMAINVEGTVNIVNMCLHHQVKKLIHVSSIAAIGRSIHETSITEKTIWQKSELNTSYAKSKFLAEQEVWRGHSEGLNIGIVNPSIILGAGYWDNGSCKLFSTVHKGLKFYPIGSTGFVDVRDVAQSMLAIARSEKAGERYIINGSNTPYQQLFNLMADELEVKRPYIKVNPLLRALSWRIEKLKGKITGNHPLITRDTALLSSLSYQYINTKSIEELGIEYTPLESTVKDSCSLFQDYLKSSDITSFTNR
ncbi:MAG: dihydroflavonol-4-reductase [Maribacter sp.]|jgi:dihydroflavonol-4-reductase